MSVNVLLTANMISSVSYTENIDTALLQSSTRSTPPNTNTAPIATSILHFYHRTSTIVSLRSYNRTPPSCPVAPTTAPRLSHPTTLKQRLTQLSFPFPASTVSNPGIRATVVQRAKLMYKNPPWICRLLGISNDYHAVMNDY
ncbi:hypothetical protein BDD12DRAFT_886024 [Trichophaea hybrida]|nr:hypothetical protein BDD12DRAFT_886024 [Trichophaea hybrida]